MNDILSAKFVERNIIYSYLNIINCTILIIHVELSQMYKIESINITAYWLIMSL